MRLKELTMMVEIIIIVFGFLLFMSGFHSIDLSHNMLLISYETGIDVYRENVDINLLGQGKTYEEWYLIGWGECLLGILLVFSGSLMFGYMVGEKNDDR